jgi:nitrate reductase cytochrome c-type subunit
MVLDGCDNLLYALGNLLKINRRNTGFGQTKPFCVPHQVHCTLHIRRNTNRILTCKDIYTAFMDQASTSLRGHSAPLSSSTK